MIYDITTIPVKMLFALLIYGEAGGEPLEGKIAVASVVHNRYKAGGWFGTSYRDVMLKPRQFSCFNPDDAMRKRIDEMITHWGDEISKSAALRECWWVASGFLDGYLRPTLSADHYHTISVDPAWDDKMLLIATIGDHEFYKRDTA